MTIPPLSLGLSKGAEWLKALHAEMFSFGQAHGLMNKSAERASVHALAGRLQAGPGGNLELTVPSSLIKGVFDALDEPGAEFVVRNNRTESAIKVMTKDEVDKLGGINHITERGHSYHYTLGPIVELPATGGYDKLWAISIQSDDLENIRRSYGLETSPQLGFYIPVGCKKKRVTEDNEVSKLAGLLKQGVHWSDDVGRNLLNGRKYPLSYLTGELGELGESIKKMDWPNFKEELGDSAYAAQMILAQKLGLNLPLIGASAPVDKFYARRKGWEDIFKERNVPFSNDYLAGGSNLKKPKKIQAALGLAGHAITKDEARALSLKHGGGIEDDWPGDDSVSKLAGVYTASGEKVQGVGLRKMYHSLLEEQGLPGLGVNNEDTGDVELSFDGDEAKRQEVFDQLGARVQAKTGHPVTFAPVDVPQSSVPIRMSNKDAERLNAIHHLAYRMSNMYDPADSLMDSNDNFKQKLADRFRLQVSQRGLKGTVPSRAAEQLLGTRPMYQGMMPDRLTRTEEEALSGMAEAQKQRLMKALSGGRGFLTT